MSAQEMAIERLRDICVSGSADKLQLIADTIVPAAEQIADRFYEEMLSNPETSRFLDHAVVKQKLRDSLTAWIRRLFALRSSSDLLAFVEAQQNIGAVHARIRVPMHLVAHGARYLRREFSRRLAQRVAKADELADVFLLVGDLIDYSVIIMNEAYMRDALRGEREAQSLRETLLGTEVAVECERARATLFDWARQTVDQIHREGKLKQPVGDGLGQSSFGAWLQFKAEFMIPEGDTLNTLKTQMRGLDSMLGDLHSERGDLASASAIADRIDQTVSAMARELSGLAQKTLAAESGRDPLTRLLNRRYLPTVLQRETRLSSAHDVTFSVLTLDIDHFKRVNDTFGHGIGDAVLQRVAEVLLDAVRTSDFVFRYGGEEFLLVLGNISTDDAVRFAERLRDRISRHPIDVDGKFVRITVSIGISVFDGHPDYNRMIFQSDAALYRAKEEGRDRCVLGSGSML